MSISLTWANYALIVIVCLGLYYLVIAFFVQRRKIINASSEEANANSFEAFQSPEEAAVKQNASLTLFGEQTTQEKFEPLPTETNTAPEAQDFADEIVAYTSSCDKTITKEKLMQAIQRIKGSNHQYVLNQLIIISTESYCSIHVSADELSEMWRS